MEKWGFSKLDNSTKNWPKTEDGEPVKPVFLEHLTGSQLDVDMEVNLLDAFNIPYVRAYSNNGEFSKMILGFAGTGVDIFVPETMLEDAQNILSGDAVDIDIETEENL